MKIVLFTFLYEPEIGGGAAVVVNQLAHMLTSNSYSVVVVTSWNGNYIKSESIDGIKIIRIPPMNIYWVGDKDRQPGYRKVIWQLVDIWNPFIYRIVRQILENEKPDVIHTHKIRGLSPSIWCAASSSGVKRIVHTCHDYELLSPEGYFMGKIGQLAKEQNVVMRPYQVIRKRISNLVSDVIAPSKYVLNCHLKMNFFPEARASVIPNTHGYNSEQIRSLSEFSILRPGVSPTRFLYLGRLDNSKGVDILCKAFLLAASKKPGIRLTVSGWGPLEQTLREEYKNNNNIIFTGAIFGEQKTQILKNNDVLIAPSVFEEPFGIVIVEAFAFGIPVITSRAGAFPEIIQDGQTGLLVEPGSVEELAAAILRITTDKKLFNPMSRNCLEQAKIYTSERFLNNYLRIYETTG